MLIRFIKALSWQKIHFNNTKNSNRHKTRQMFKTGRFADKAGRLVNKCA